MKRILIALLIAVPVGMIGAVIAWDAVWTPMCESTVLSEQGSPNGTFVFSLFRRNCGATTDYVTSLSVRRAGDALDRSAGDAVLIIEGDVPVAASWIDSDRLEVIIPKGADIFRSERDWNGVAISYVTR